MVGVDPRKRVVNPSSLIVRKVAFQNPKQNNVLLGQKKK